MGIMGKPMAKNLAKNGFSVVGTDVNTAIFPEMEEAGVHCVATVAELAAQCELILAILPRPDISLDVALGEQGIAKNAKAGTIYVDMSSITPELAKKLGEGLSAANIAFMDAPVSGGETGAINGTLSIMAGGDKGHYEKALPVLQAMSGSVLLAGGIGAGSLVKLANQIIVGVNIAAVAEALALVAKGNVDPAVAFEAFRGGVAGSAVLELKGPMMLDRNVTPGARMEIHIKDLRNVQETAHNLSAPIPIASQVMEMMQSLQANGMGKYDHSALVRFYEITGNVHVERGKNS